MIVADEMIVVDRMIVMDRMIVHLPDLNPAIVLRVIIILFGTVRSWPVAHCVKIKNQRNNQKLWCQNSPNELVTKEISWEFEIVVRICT